MASQRFCLRWNNHQSNLLSVFDQLLHAETFTDVTLAVEGQYLKAHKMVLSACSPYFQALFVNHPEKHPIVILKDVPFADMKSLLDFMYRGEVSVDQERLTAFLRVAESLRIKGLTEVNDDKPNGNGRARSASPPPSATNAAQNRIHPYVLQQQQQRKSQAAQAAAQQQLHNTQQSTGMLVNNPLLGSALTQPKRKRGRPRKLSGSDMGEEFEEDYRDNLLQGSPSEMLEVKMGTESFSNSGNEGSDENDTRRSDNEEEMDTSTEQNSQNRPSSKDTSSKKDDQAGDDEDDGLLIPKLEPLPISSLQAQLSQSTKNPIIQQSLLQNPPQNQQTQQNQLNQQNIQQSQRGPQIRVSPFASQSASANIVNVLNHLHQKQLQKHQMAQHIEQEQLKNSLSSLNSETSRQQSPGASLYNQQLQQKLIMNSPTGGAQLTISSVHGSSLVDLQNNNNESISNSNHSTPSSASSLNSPQKNTMRRRVRRKNNQPDDQAESLTEMSVRGLNLFRYASIQDGVYQCTECAKDNIQKTFKNKYSFQRHAFLYHEGSQRKVFPCPVCRKEFSRPDKMKNHMKTTHDCYMPKDCNFPIPLIMAQTANIQHLPQELTVAPPKQFIMSSQLQSQLQSQMSQIVNLTSQ